MEQLRCLNKAASEHAEDPRPVDDPRAADAQLEPVRADAPHDLMQGARPTLLPEASAALHGSNDSLVDCGDSADVLPPPLHNLNQQHQAQGRARGTDSLEPLENGKPRRWPEFCVAATAVIFVGLAMIPYHVGLVVPGQTWYTAAAPLENGDPARCAEFVTAASAFIFMGLVMLPEKLKKGQAWYTGAHSLILLTVIGLVACVFWGNTHKP
jgi:hypothetical protein